VASGPVIYTSIVTYTRKRTEHVITNAELNRFKGSKTKETRLEKLFGENLNIELVRVYSNPLNSIQVTKVALHHAFVLFKLLNRNKWWSIEKKDPSQERRIHHDLKRRKTAVKSFGIATNGNDVQLVQQHPTREIEMHKPNRLYAYTTSSVTFMTEITSTILTTFKIQTVNISPIVFSRF
jgi:hypothetical protein